MVKIASADPSDVFSDYSNRTLKSLLSSSSSYIFSLRNVYIVVDNIIEDTREVY